VPNLYPIVGGPTAGPGATGAHEVVILSPDHVADFGSLADSQAAEVLAVLRDRARVHADAGHTYVQVLVNHGRAAGASIAHPHAQVLAIDVVPPAVAAAALRVAAGSADLVGDDHAAALEAGSHVLAADGIAAWCPLASGSPFEVRIASLSAGARFEAASDPEIHSCALVLRDVLGALARVLGDPPYNVVVHGAAAGTSSSGAGPTDPGRWWIEVTPRVSVVAGFEVGTGLLVNTEDPVVAAGRLREALASVP
jgi:UDPglucose--hexose-1-phosphate uridylyltransferase